MEKSVLKFRVVKTLPFGSYGYFLFKNNSFIVMDGDSYLFTHDINSEGQLSVMNCPECSKRYTDNVVTVVIGNDKIYGCVRCNFCNCVIILNMINPSKQILIDDLKIDTNLIKEKWQIPEHGYLS